MGTRLRRLLELLDGDLDAMYRDDGEGYRARYTPVMKALAKGGSLTIKQIAIRSGTSHSAASQTVARMMAENLLQPSVGRDARERKVALSPRGVGMLPKLAVRWAANDEAARRLEEEIDLPLSASISAAIEALETRSFQDRVLELRDTAATTKGPRR